jgi:hypothetical protein
MGGLGQVPISINLGILALTDLWHKSLNSGIAYNHLYSPVLMKNYSVHRILTSIDNINNVGDVNIEIALKLIPESFTFTSEIWPHCNSGVCSQVERINRNHDGV